VPSPSTHTLLRAGGGAFQVLLRRMQMAAHGACARLAGHGLLHTASALGTRGGAHSGAEETHGLPAQSRFPPSVAARKRQT